MLHSFIKKEPGDMGLNISKHKNILNYQKAWAVNKTSQICDIVTILAFK